MSPPPWKKTTGNPSRKLANESLAGNGANTKKPFEAIPSVMLIWLRRKSAPSFHLCAPVVCDRESYSSYVFWAVLRGPVIGSPALAYPLTIRNGGPCAADSVLLYPNPSSAG